MQAARWAGPRCWRWCARAARSATPSVSSGTSSRFRAGKRWKRHSPPRRTPMRCASVREAMEKTFASATDADAVRVYLGYSGWTEPQLEHELDLGAWYIFQGSAKAVFDSNPESLWERFIRETELRIASRGATGIIRLRVAGGGLPPRD